MEAGDVGIMLDVDFDIATRTGLHCAPLVHEQIGTMKIHGSVRFSIGAFNTEKDIDTAIHAMSEIATRVPKPEVLEKRAQIRTVSRPEESKR
jgi:selenocysteine lyase/cysteine desulfurase